MTGDTENRAPEVNRRRVLGGIVTLGAAAAAAGAGTAALLSDTESSTDNTVAAGTLDLAVDGQHQAVTTVDVAGVAPGDSGSGSTTLENVGDVNGYLDVAFGTAANGEGQNPDAETDTADPGDLGSVLEVTVSVGGTEVRSGTFDQVFDGTEADLNEPLAAGATTDLTLAWSLPSTVGNDVQGDVVSGDLTFELGQDTSQ